MKGFFIVLEGPDRSGKSTQAKLLAQWLRSRRRKVLLTREPGGTRLSEKLREILLDPKEQIEPLTELFLYETSRAKHTLSIILPALASGKVVVSDRFTMSTTAYQGYGRRLPVATVETLNKIATCGIAPDLTVVLRVPGRIFEERERLAQKLFGADRMERESAGFRRRVNGAYKVLAARPGVVSIDAARGIEEIHAEIKSLVAARLGLKEGRARAASGKG
ncbi:MAG TPA: dTMP kinase [Elusimicrobiales bacterium]|nr:dTMP kinase [Elusimicrobiales bacterium]